MPFVDVRFLKGYEMIQSHIGSTQECGVVLKLERFSHLSGRFFGLGSPIRLEALSNMLACHDICVRIPFAMLYITVMDTLTNVQL